MQNRDADKTKVGSETTFRNRVGNPSVNPGSHR